MAGEIFDRTKEGAKNGLEVRDFVIVEINPDMSLNEIRFFEKRHYFVFVGGGLGIRTTDQLANVALDYGEFDYEYVQASEDNEAFTFFYTFLEEYGDKWKKYDKWLGAISKHASDEGYETDKISLKSNATNFQILPAKAGHLLIVEYYYGSKKLDMRIEKFNY